MKIARTGLLCCALLYSRLLAAPSESIEVLHAITGAQGMPRGTPVVAPDGTIYGVTQYDGHFHGSIFALHPDGGGYVYEMLYAFQGEDGLQPKAGLIRGSDGLLYGTTAHLEPSGGGTIFRFDPATRALTTLYAFPASGENGVWPEGALIEGESLVFYGTTRFGGDMGFGTVFRFDTQGSFTRLHSFAGPDGKQPFGRLYRSPSGDLYGTASAGGGVNSYGTVFRIDPQGVFGVIHTFEGGVSDGLRPLGGLTLGPDGYPWGATQGGGADHRGTLFRIVGGTTVEQVHSFDVSEGSGPRGDLTVAGSSLVGVTGNGGTADRGTVFRFTPPGDLDTLHSFSGTDGRSPEAGLAVDPVGNAFGNTWFGGETDHGVVYSVTAGGSASVLHAFAPEGAVPLAPLIQASNGRIYGTASYPYGEGSIFEWDPSADTFRSPVTLSAPELTSPRASVTETAGGWFYGTSYGDLYSLEGSVWRAKLDGTSELVHHFIGGDACRPVAGLTLSADTRLYGTTPDGYGSQGTFFRIDPDAGYESLFQFDDTTGRNPCGRLIETAPGVFAGTARTGGLGGAGTIFQVDSSGGSTVIHDFGTDGSGASEPCSDLTIGSDGAYYVTTLGAWDGQGPLPGGLFRIENGSVETLGVFHGSNGAFPYAGLAEASSGTFYGVTAQGGASDLGTLYRIDSKGRFDSLFSFDGPTTGSGPSATLLRAADGYLYGTAVDGGWWGGTLFRISAGAPLVTVDPTSGPAEGGSIMTITGSRFQPDALVRIGSVEVTDAQIGSSTSATGTVPALPPGTLHHVLVQNPDRSSGLVIDGWLADFLDVPQGDPFHAYVEQIARRRIASGYGDGSFGRNDPLTRAQMAVLLLKAKRGSGYVPPPCAGLFGDTPCPGLFTDWVEQLAAEGITGGCGNGNYCPDAAVRRDQMAPFLLKAKHGASYQPPPCSGEFQDVPCTPGQGFSDWIEALVAEGITAGCSAAPALYCPSSNVTRGQTSVFLVKTDP